MGQGPFILAVQGFSNSSFLRNSNTSYPLLCLGKPETTSGSRLGAAPRRRTDTGGTSCGWGTR